MSSFLRPDTPSSATGTERSVQMPPNQQPPVPENPYLNLMQLQGLLGAFQSTVQPNGGLPQPMWGAQMPAMGFPNTITPPVAGFAPPQYNMQQALANALAMSTPVTGHDEPELLQKLLERAKSGQSYREALEGLHGKGGHSASMWKDYYLEHKDRLDAWVSKMLRNEDHGRSSQDSNSKKPSLPTVKMPSHTTLPTLKRPPLPIAKRPSATPSKVESTHSDRARLSSTKPAKPSKKDQTKIPVSTPLVPVEAPTGRRTVNSLTAPTPVFGSRLPAPNVHVKIPQPPSRSPTPPHPDTFVTRATGYKYTDVDREFFIKFIGWELKKNPDLNRQELCQLLSEKAAHHSATSWASFWSNNHDIPDKILAAAHGELEDPESEDEILPVSSRVNYREPSTSSSSAASCSQTQSPDVEVDDEPIQVYSDSEMGQQGQGYTKADLYVTAKYIASFTPEAWNSTSGVAKWSPYAEKYSQRTYKSWAEYYRRNEKDLLRLAKKIRLQNAAGGGTSSSSSSQSPMPQMARPTNPPVREKRKADAELDDSPNSKRHRHVDSESSDSDSDSD